MTSNMRPGTEIGSDGLVHGRDPRRMTQAELTAMGHEPMSAIVAIRAHCLDCCVGSPDEVRKCVVLHCPSWPFRMGKSPWKTARTLTDEQRDALAARGRALAAARRGDNAVAASNLLRDDSEAVSSAIAVAEMALPAHSTRSSLPSTPQPIEGGQNR